MRIEPARVGSGLRTVGRGVRLHVPRIVVVTRLDKEGEVMQAIDSGARAYLRQDAPPAELMDAIRHVARGGALYLCQRTAALFRQEPRRGLLRR
jgi:two-component system nitrate/nitrite response regulator NarL